MLIVEIIKDVAVGAVLNEVMQGSALQVTAMEPRSIQHLAQTLLFADHVAGSDHPSGPGVLNPIACPVRNPPT
jgi:hypothetical protein